LHAIGGAARDLSRDQDAVTGNLSGFQLGARARRAEVGNILRRTLHFGLTADREQADQRRAFRGGLARFQPPRPA
jgi:hypothetical protein